MDLTEVSKKGEGDFVLSGISLTQRKLEKIAIAGETGAGKSTLLKLIAGLAQPDGGRILFEGEKVMGPEDQLVPGHAGIAYLSQHFELQKSLRVEQVLGYSNALSERAADTLYSVCQIDHLLKRRTDQLSGGEKTLTATALLFAIYLIKPAPFCILDEVDAPLDDANVGKFTNMIRQFSENSQFIIVTHNKMTMSTVDIIYGVTMQEPGVSKLVPVDFRGLN